MPTTASQFGATHLSLKAFGIWLTEVSAEEHAAVVNQFAATVKSTDGLTTELVELSIRQCDEFVRETILLSDATAKMLSIRVLKDSDPKANQVILAAFGLVSCIANAKRITS